MCSLLPLPSVSCLVLRIDDECRRDVRLCLLHSYSLVPLARWPGSWLQGWWAADFFASVILLISILPKWFSWGFFVLVYVVFVFSYCFFLSYVLTLPCAGHLLISPLSLCVCFPSPPFLSPPLNVHYAIRTIFRLWFYFVCTI